MPHFNPWDLRPSAPIPMDPEGWTEAEAGAGQRHLQLVPPRTKLSAHKLLFTLRLFKEAKMRESSEPVVSRGAGDSGGSPENPGPVSTTSLLACELSKRELSAPSRSVCPPPLTQPWHGAPVSL